MPEDLRITIVEACLRDGRGGSPTAVLWDQSLSEGELRQVPALTSTSHAVFVSANGPQPTLRFFTRTGELPACGHGTVAALAFLAAGRDYETTLLTAERSLAGQARPHGALTRAEFHPGEIELREPTADEHELAVELLGNAPADVCVGTIGRPRLLVATSSPAALANLKPDQQRLRSACDRLGLLGCYVYAETERRGRPVARMFAPSIGVPEDIANANSTACLAAHLAGSGIAEIAVDMGDSLGSLATITATTRGREVRVGGEARIAGTVRLERTALAAAAAD